ncbi:MAG: hypothetical protein NTU48_07420 [Legionellales bacterium]|nr:hypothetical protein [Legionellales bacterium]
MNNIGSENNQFISDLNLYIQEKNLTLQHPTIIDTLIENPDIQRLLSIWMQKNNTIQLHHVLVEIPNALSTMDSIKQGAAISVFFERAKKLSDWMPRKTNYDLAIQSVRERFADKVDFGVQVPEVDRWFDLNRPVAELSEEDMAKLDKYEFFINGDIFSANTVLDMDPATCAAFDAQVKSIIENHASFLLPEKDDRRKLKPTIFSDELLDRIKKDPHIIALLAQVTPWIPNPPQKAAAAIQETPTNYDPELIKTLLGLEHSDDELSVSGLTDQDTHSGVTDQDTHSEEEYVPNRKLTFWQNFNIESNEDLNALVELEIVDPFNVPDRELTTAEEQRYAGFINQIILKQEQLSQRSATSRESTTSSLSGANSSNPLKPVRYEKINHQQKFIPVIKDFTHNREHQERNRRQRNLDPITGKDLAKQQQTFKERLPQKHRDPDTDSAHSSKSSGGYRKK